MAITQIAIFTPVQKAVGLLQLGILANATNALAQIGYTFVDSATTLSTALFVVTAAVSMLATAFGAPVVNLLVLERAGSAQLGFAMGLVSTAEQLGRFAAPIVLSILYEKVGADAAFVATAVGLCLAALCYAAVAALPKEAADGGSSSTDGSRAAAAPATAQPTLREAISKLIGMGRATKAFGAAADEARKRARTAAIDNFVVQGRYADDLAATAVDSYVVGCSPSTLDRQRSARLFAQAAEAEAEAAATAAQADAAEASEKAATSGKPLDML